MSCIRFFFVLFLFVFSLQLTHKANSEAVPDWAFPGFGAATVPLDGWDNRQMLHVPGSAKLSTEAEIRSRQHVIDWFPDTHQELPHFMIHSDDPDVIACAKCHMPSGTGRPENASIVGLSAEYIIAQVEAIISGRRTYSDDLWPPTLMRSAAMALNRSQIEQAARYYASLPVRKYVDIIESDQIPAIEAYGQVYFVKGGPREPLGARIIEIPEDRELFERRDPYGRYKAYVPKGSIQRGRLFAQSGGGEPARICTTCHGAELKGGTDMPGPAIAGKFPVYLFRQLYGFKTGARQGANAEMMAPVVQDMTLSRMIDLAAYAASIKP
jgi:cytochrome c553